ncbi:DUF6599 family protein [candidate division CSSED10-310 bacterium]|uniref:DUF6599 family protein n=1 Tax=candidate division CSSED10-310 bacterium TaxID=2855610 RepID=A0ABV6Z0R1_UNCC1
MILKRVILMVLFIILSGSWQLKARAADSRDLLPHADEFKGWTLTGKVLHFPAQDLWKHIDGAAEQYLAYSCVSLTVAYQHQEETDSEISVEIYRMKDDLTSFGIYAIQRPREGEFLSVGAQGYQESNILNFYKGLFYIKLQAEPDQPHQIESMRTLAEIMARKINSAISLPVLFKNFPQADLIPNSFNFIPKGVMGMKDVDFAFEATYKKENQEVKLFLLPHSDNVLAEKTLSLIKNSVRAQEPILAKNISHGMGFQAQDRYRGPILAIQSGKDLVVLNGATDQKWAESLIIQIFNNLKRKAAKTD